VIVVVGVGVVVAVVVLPVDFDLIEMYKPVCCCKMDEVE
jgi:hypothetical protein